MPKQHEIVAIEADYKKRSKQEQTEMYKMVQKSDLYFGLHRDYQAFEDDGERLPPEHKKIQRDLNDDMKAFDDVSSRLLDLVATKDMTNTTAFADLIVDGETLAERVPVTTLLSLEKELHHVRAFYSALPTLPLDTPWTKDEASGQYVAPEIETVRSKKEQMPIVLYDATKEHPAQTQLITKDINVGAWRTRKTSSAMPEPSKRRLLARIDKLIDAVKQARERANQSDVIDKKIGPAIFGYLHR
ncbi:MAG: hypothetical protein H6727_13845 [Myxococcales bacterium]|nr:hypothetical protein [Myxococcales bacterium]